MHAKILAAAVRCGTACGRIRCKFHLPYQISTQIQRRQTRHELICCNKYYVAVTQIQRRLLAGIHAPLHCCVSRLVQNSINPFHVGLGCDGFFFLERSNMGSKLGRTSIRPARLATFSSTRPSRSVPDRNLPRRMGLLACTNLRFPK